MIPKTPEEARELQGITLREAARRLRPGSRPYSLRYIQRMERYGDVPFHLAEAMARLYKCDMKLFLRGTRKNG